jgi:hypothetical protein
LAFDIQNYALSVKALKGKFLRRLFRSLTT